MTQSNFARFAAPTLLLALTLAGCSGQQPQSNDDDGVIAIVASTDVYGDIATSIAGHAAVKSFITNPAQDPHEYEASAQDRLALDKADVVIKNGGGFDPFVDALLESGDAKPVVAPGWPRQVSGSPHRVPLSNGEATSPSTIRPSVK